MLGVDTIRHHLRLKQDVCHIPLQGWIGAALRYYKHIPLFYSLFYQIQKINARLLRTRIFVVNSTKQYIVKTECSLYYSIIQDRKLSTVTHKYISYF
jgi:hypothetical protein